MSAKKSPFRFSRKLRKKRKGEIIRYVIRAYSANANR